MSNLNSTRWKVIANFPGSFLEIGDIVVAEKYHTEVDDYSVGGWISDRNEGIFPNEFPNIFQLMKEITAKT